MSFPTSLPASRIRPASEAPVLRWGILGSGWIAERFIESVRAHTKQDIVEHGSLLFGEEGQFFSCPAYPLEDIHHPTGAGDAFAGVLAGYLAKDGDEVNFAGLRCAVVYGSVLASYNVEAFSLERLRTLTWAQISERFDTFRCLSQFDAS